MTVTNEEYFVYEGGEELWGDRIVDESSDLVDDEETICTCVKVNSEHYFKGYFFYNDMDDYEDKEEHHPVCFNNEVDLDDYLDSNNSHGHFQCTYVEEWVAGELVNTVQVSDANGWI
jgi:hypothetical protein